MRPRRLGGVLAAALLCAVACASPAPVLEQRTYAPPKGALARVAVIPFYAHRSYQGSSLLGGVAAERATATVTAQIRDALAARGVEVVPAADVAAAVAKVQRATAAIDTVVYADLAGRELGATGVIVGEVLRFRGPRGASASARKPASVAYQVTLYEAPDAYKLWTGRFDETQFVPPDSGNGDSGNGPRIEWRSAEEISLRGARAVANSLVPDS
ncbi:MAG: hypothetical protein ACE5FL_07805 [Myxococcota bacterium]